MISMKEKKKKLLLWFPPFTVKIIISKILLQRCRQTCLSSIANQPILLARVCEFFFVSLVTNWLHTSAMLLSYPTLPLITWGECMYLSCCTRDRMILIPNYLRRVYCSMVVTASSIPSAPCFTRGRMMRSQITWGEYISPWLQSIPSAPCFTRERMMWSLLT